MDKQDMFANLAPADKRKQEFRPAATYDILIKLAVDFSYACFV